ncbi:MAG: hypothetical protein V3W44_10935 [Dehalococcoidales bacterium]
MMLSGGINAGKTAWLIDEVETRLAAGLSTLVVGQRGNVIIKTQTDFVVWKRWFLRKDEGSGQS